MPTGLKYIDPHKEGTFTYLGKEYYVSELYDQPLNIISPVMLFPSQVNKGVTQKTLTSGKTPPVYSSAFRDGKLIFFFDIPGVTKSPDWIQYFAYFDAAKLQPTTFRTGKTKQETAADDIALDNAIKKDVEYQKLNLSWAEQLINSLLPGNTYLWIKKNGKWVLLTGASLIAYKLFKSNKGS